MRLFFDIDSDNERSHYFGRSLGFLVVIMVNYFTDDCDMFRLLMWTVYLSPLSQPARQISWLQARRRDWLVRDVLSTSQGRRWTIHISDSEMA